MKLIDCFTFYNELDMLYLRLTELYDTVDHFVLVEAVKTFAGNDKPLYYEENKERFSKFADKIVHIIVKDVPMDGDSWSREHNQRNCIKVGLFQLELQCSDIIIISDVDEIPDVNTLNTIKSMSINNVFCLEQDFYYYDLNHKFDNKWYHAKICNYNTTDYVSIQHIREMSCNIIPNGGWHFSYFGNANFISNKIKQFSHQELNIPLYTDKDKINELIERGEDLFYRGIDPIFIDINNNKYLPNNYKMLI